MATIMTRGSLAIGEDQIRQYETDGAICLRGVVSVEWIERLREATDRLISKGGMEMTDEGSPGRFTGDLFMFHKDDEFKAFAFEGPTAAIARSLLRSKEVRLFNDQLFVKEPGTTTPTPWHHDQTYWHATGDGMCSVWVTMDTVSKETSGLEYVRGSHRWNRRFDPAQFGSQILPEGFHDEANEQMPDIDANRDQYELLSWDMEPGDVLVHHSLAIHGAGGNRSATQRRRAVSIRWFGDEAYFRPNKMMTEEAVGLKAGDKMTGPMFPLVTT